MYLIVPRHDAAGQSLALLCTADGASGLGLRWDAATLPYFNLWKNTGALEDGFVTGLEPATGFPRFRAREREAGRVPNLGPGKSRTMSLSIEVLDKVASDRSFRLRRGESRAIAGGAGDSPRAVALRLFGRRHDGDRFLGLRRLTRLIGFHADANSAVAWLHGIDSDQERRGLPGVKPVECLEADTIGGDVAGSSGR